MSAPRNRVAAADLAPVLFQSSVPMGCVAVLCYYGDVSGSQREEFVVFAGYLGRPAQWKRFEREWETALGEAKVEAFHATDFFNFRGDFKGWDRDLDKHTRFAKRFTAIAERQTECGVGRGVHVPPFLKLVQPVTKGMTTPHRRFTPLMFCVSATLQNVLRIADVRRKQVAFVFEGDPGVGEAIDYVSWLCRKGEPWTEGIATLTTGDKDFLPLQGADLLAHECWRHMKGSIQGTGRARRKSLNRLLQRQRVLFGVAEEETLRPIIPLIATFLRERPDGLGPFARGRKGR